MCNRNCGSNFAAFVLGVLMGAAAGVLLAPAKGETTRRKLKRWANDTYEDILYTVAGSVPVPVLIVATGF